MNIFRMFSSSEVELENGKRRRREGEDTGRREGGNRESGEMVMHNRHCAYVCQFVEFYWRGQFSSAENKGYERCQLRGEKI